MEQIDVAFGAGDDSLTFDDLGDLEEVDPSSMSIPAMARIPSTSRPIRSRRARTSTRASRPATATTRSRSIWATSRRMPTSRWRSTRVEGSQHRRCPGRW